MTTNLHLTFSGHCDAAFSFYEKVFATKRMMTMTYDQAPPAPAGSPSPSPEMKDKVMHTAMQLGSMVLMGCDAPGHLASPVGGFQIAVNLTDKADVERIYDELKEGGSVQMPLAPTFWSPLFGMCTDKFGVAWMVGVPGEAPPAA